MKNIYKDRTEWKVNGKLHRDDGPAIIFKSGTKVYYIHGLLHRVDGPAIEYINGFITYHIHGKKLSKKEFDMYNFIESL